MVVNPCKWSKAPNGIQSLLDTQVYSFLDFFLLILSNFRETNSYNIQSHYLLLTFLSSNLDSKSLKLIWKSTRKKKDFPIPNSFPHLFLPFSLQDIFPCSLGLRSFIYPILASSFISPLTLRGFERLSSSTLPFSHLVSLP